MLNGSLSQFFGASDKIYKPLYFSSTNAVDFHGIGELYCQKTLIAHTNPNWGYNAHFCGYADD